MEHHFNVDIAKQYGVLEAIILNHFEFWIKTNEANNRNFYDGYYWTYNSTRALQEIFPYASQRKIQNVLKHLEDEGIIQTGNYNKLAYDRTLWYAFTEKGKCIMQFCKMEDAKKGNGESEKVKAIPNNNTNNKSDNLSNIYSGEGAKKPGNENKAIEEFTENAELKSALYDFIKMRKTIKKPMTDRAITLFLGKLKELSTDENTQIKIIEQSIIHNWQTVYPLKDEPKKREAKPPVRDENYVDLDDVF